jgi:hypothetical protein
LSSRSRDGGRLIRNPATARIVITMRCGDACPMYPVRRYLDWDLPDPADLDLAAVCVWSDMPATTSRCLLDGRS